MKRFPAPEIRHLILGENRCLPTSIQSMWGGNVGVLKFEFAYPDHQYRERVSLDIKWFTTKKDMSFLSGNLSEVCTQDQWIIEFNSKIDSQKELIKPHQKKYSTVVESQRAAQTLLVMTL